MLEFVTSQISWLHRKPCLYEFYVNIFSCSARLGLKISRRGKLDYLHVISRTLFDVGFSLSLVNMEDRLPLILEKSADMGRY